MEWVTELLSDTTKRLLWDVVQHVVLCRSKINFSKKLFLIEYWMLIYNLYTSGSPFLETIFNHDWILTQYEQDNISYSGRVFK